jgi:ketosteroid isomerase-like protein
VNFGFFSGWSSGSLVSRNRVGEVSAITFRMQGECGLDLSLVSSGLDALCYLLPFNSPIASGTEQIRQFWSQLMSKPGFVLRFEPTKIVLSKSHDMAYEVGTFALKLDDAQGIPTGTLGKYVVVWRKQRNTAGKQADIFNTDK